MALVTRQFDFKFETLPGSSGNFNIYILRIEILVAGNVLGLLTLETG